MKRFARLLAVTLGFGVLGFTMSLLPQKNAGGAGSAPVTIAGPLPLPVTVSGTVAAQQSGNWNVGVTGGPVAVQNALSNGTPAALLTQSADNPALQPFGFSQDEVSGFPVFNFQVPPGRTLVIEEFSMRCIENPSNFEVADFLMDVSSNGVVTHFIFAPTSLGPPASELVATEMTRIYADPGTLVTVGTSGGVESGSDCGLSIVGHLVNPAF